MGQRTYPGGQTLSSYPRPSISGWVHERGRAQTWGVGTHLKGVHPVTVLIEGIHQMHDWSGTRWSCVTECGRAFRQVLCTSMGHSSYTNNPMDRLNLTSEKQCLPPEYGGHMKKCSSETVHHVDFSYRYQVSYSNHGERSECYIGEVRDF